MKSGCIIKVVSGVYTVKLANGQEVLTKPRGVFRKKKITPLVGDKVQVQLSDHPDQENTIVEVLKRNNTLFRPSVANVDIGIIVMSVVLPEFSTHLLDKFLVQLEHFDIKPLIYLTKTDLLNEDEREKIDKYQKAYQRIGYDFYIPSKQGELKENWKNDFKDQLIVLMGQSGVGKSTLLNHLNKDLKIKTGQASKSLGRGKHTTRHVELYPLYGGLIADTPGFSSLSLEGIEKEELSQYYPEIWERRSQCKFAGCIHDQEPKCAVKEAVYQGEIPSYRYQSYINLLKDIKNKKVKY